jgi:hypothetical protein
VSWIRQLLLRLQEKLNWYEEQFRLFQPRRFGSSNEKYPDQLTLFNEVDSILDALPQEEGKFDEAVTDQRHKPGRIPLSKHIPRQVVRHELPEAERVCGCGHALHEAGKTRPKCWKSFRHKSRSSCMCRSNMAAVPVKMAC